MKLRKKVGIVTGAARGMGRAIAIALAREGADVVVVDMEQQQVEAVADEIRALKCDSLAMRVDVSDRQQVGRMVEKALDRFNKIDILVNNAGIIRPAPAESMEETDWCRVIDVNLKAQFLCCQAVGRQMIKQGSGKIVNIASTAANRAGPGLAAYAASKAGIVQLTKVLAIEWGRHNINVNSVSPGYTKTAMVDGLAAGDPAFEERIRSIPLLRANEPEDIADAVVFLSSPGSDNITGHDLVVDGGTTAISPTSAVAAALVYRKQ